VVIAVAIAAEAAEGVAADAADAAEDVAAIAVAVVVVAVEDKQPCRDLMPSNFERILVSSKPKTC
jgi:hypothetical protein